jgi:hypothetical protein
MSGKLILFPGNTKTINTAIGKVMLFDGTQATFNRILEKGAPVFAYKGYFVYVDYKENEYLKLLCQEKAILELLKSYANVAMDENMIAEYPTSNEKAFDESKDLQHTIFEWSKHPERRIDELDASNIENLKLNRDYVKTKRMASNY